MCKENRACLSDYTYEMDESKIAKYPKEKRAESKLLILNKETGQINIDIFNNIIRYLPEKTMLVANNSYVIPARLIGKKKTGGKVEFLPLTPLPIINKNMISENGHNTANINGLVKSSKPVKIGEEFEISSEMIVKVLERFEYGKCNVLIKWKGDLEDIIDDNGKVPLPPYIKRESEKEDFNRYQTIYSNRNKKGSIAAPTAGLHMTQNLKKEILSNGHLWEEITLHVGYGTFSPIRTENLNEHKMHEEYVSITDKTANNINTAIKNGYTILGLGTTSVRALESVASKLGKIQQFEGLVDLFIKPGYDFKIVENMITNFHLSGSSLLVMVSTFAGRKHIRDSYKTALDNDFRFFSYGDAMLIV